MKLSGRTAIVTGAANGIGKATAIKLANDGAKVAVLDLDQEAVKQVAETIRSSGGTAMPLTVDVTKDDEIKEAVASVLAEFAQIDILVNNAGGGWKQEHLPFWKTPENSWKWILDLNINGTLLFTHAVLKHMIGRKYGKIINIASIAAKTGIPNLAVYSASKGAVISFTKSLAMELGPYNINVNSVSPGMVSTNSETPASNGTFLGRKGAPEEMASVIAFLASDESSFITGADHLVDGGRVLGPRGC
jgi:NAD(P)-dependent dehydrogenase (short-subunit alcohol dehydrogenase family)